MNENFTRKRKLAFCEDLFSLIWTKFAKFAKICTLKVLTSPSFNRVTWWHNFKT